VAQPQAWLSTIGLLVAYSQAVWQTPAIQ
jgi:hypothetical protein